MRPDLIICNTDFNMILDKTKLALSFRRQYKLAVEKMIANPGPMGYHYNELIKSINKDFCGEWHGSDLVQSLKLSLMVEKQEQDRKAALDRRDLFLKYGWDEYAQLVQIN